MLSWDASLKSISFSFFFLMPEEKRAARSQSLLISLLRSEAQSALSYWRGFNPTYITAPVTHSTTSEPFSQKVHTHSAVLKRTGCNLEAVPALSIKKAFLFQREICVCRESRMVLSDSFIACVSRVGGWGGWRNSRGRTATADVRGGCVTSVAQWRPESSKSWSVTSYSGAQIPSIHSSWSPGNSSFLFRSKMAWNTKDSLFASTFVLTVKTQRLQA